MSKKLYTNVSKPSLEQLDTLLEYYINRQYVEAEKLSLSITQEFPEHQFAWKVLGVVLIQIGRLSESLISTQKSVELNPLDSEAHNNLGITLEKLDRLNEAEVSYKKAITLEPDFAEANSNLGVILRALGRLEEAEIFLKKAIELKPKYAKAYSNLGNIMYELGRLEEAEASYRKAITLKPDSAEAWNNLFFSLQAMKLETSSIEDHLPLLEEQTSSKYVLILKSILKYRLNQGSSSSKIFLNQVINILSSTDNTFIKNPKVPSSELIARQTPPKKITALLHFGRSGSGLLHSLIDGYPGISTLPSIYFSEFFDHFSWEKIIAGGWEEMADRFVTTYDVLFDASSTVPVALKGRGYINNIGKKEGMTTVGEKKNEILSVNKKVFIKELKLLMSYHDRLDQFTFFKLVHSVYDKTLNDHNKKDLIFYHIHNPETYAQLNYLRLAPNTNWLTMVREPIINCESWIRKHFNNNDYKSISNKIFELLFQLDQSIYQNKNSVGVKLEDLKKYPKKTIPALCKWLGIKEEDSLYEMTAQGKRWWGDPSGENYEKDGMDPFGKSSINRKLGSVFSENDQYILSTLFYPYSVHFGYAEENLEKFKKDLQMIRQMIDQMFDFEKKIAQNKNIDVKNFMKSGSYLYLRSGMIERWNTLNKFHTYPNMLTLLKIN